jgi:hypothetical protein
VRSASGTSPNTGNSASGSVWPWTDDSLPSSPLTLSSRAQRAAIPIRASSSPRVGLRHGDTTTPSGKPKPTPALSRAPTGHASPRGYGPQLPCARADHVSPGSVCSRRVPTSPTTAASQGHEPTSKHPEARGVTRGPLYLLRQAIIDVLLDGNPNHMAATRNRIGHFGRAISGRNEPKRRETAQNAPKPPESGPPPCPVWEMNSDSSDPTYVRSCAHSWQPLKQAVAASVRTGADGAKQHHAANPIKDRTNVLPADAPAVHSKC